MTTFIALYRGQTINSAKVIAVATDSELVSLVASKMLQTSEADSPDPVVSAMDAGRRQALRLVAGGCDE